MNTVKINGYGSRRRRGVSRKKHKKARNNGMRARKPSTHIRCKYCGRSGKDSVMVYYKELPEVLFHENCPKTWGKNV